MKISVKSRYALAAMISMSHDYNSGNNVTVISLAEKLGLSKIYLEQVFSLLKRANLVIAVKGAQGGYQLTHQPEETSVYDILHAVEQSIFEKTAPTIEESSNGIEKAMQLAVFDQIDQVINHSLKQMKLIDLAKQAEQYQSDKSMMFYI